MIPRKGASVRAEQDGKGRQLISLRASEYGLDRGTDPSLSAALKPFNKRLSNCPLVEGGALRAPPQEHPLSFELWIATGSRDSAT